MVGPSTAKLLLTAKQEQEFWNYARKVSHSDPVLADMFEAIKVYMVLKYNYKVQNV